METNIYYMRNEFLIPILIGIFQLFLLFATTDLKRAIRRMINGININNGLDKAALTMFVARIVAQFRQADETKEAQDVFHKQTASDVIKEVTQALEAITLAKTKDVKIIISNDKINQEGFEIKLSYRLDDAV